MPGNNLQRIIFGKSTEDAVRTGSCVTCDDPDLVFSTEKERREYHISGMCAKCQWEVFGPDGQS